MGSLWAAAGDPRGAQTFPTFWAGWGGKESGCPLRAALSPDLVTSISLQRHTSQSTEEAAEAQEREEACSAPHSVAVTEPELSPRLLPVTGRGATPLFPHRNNNLGCGGERNRKPFTDCWILG